MIRRSFAIPGQWLQIGATLLFAAALTVLMIIGIRRADELQSASAALQLASELSSRPQTIRSELTLMQRGLETTTYVGESLRNLANIRESSDQAYRLLQEQLRSAALADNVAVSTALTAALGRWQTLDGELAALNTKREGELYLDTSTGSELTASGKRLKSAVDGMLATEAPNIQIMGDNLQQLSATLRSSVADTGRSLRSLLLGGTALAALLLGLVLYYALRSRQSSAAAANAQRQVANILSTVREGLFLIDRDLFVGETCSDSLTDLLRMPSPAGRSFEEVLRPLVDEATLAAALKFMKLLWKDKVHEELIESVNPLSQVEVSLPNTHGGADVKYLAFSFRRVRGADASGDYLLGAVADVTDRVLLAREIEHVKAEGDSQATLLLQLLRVDPVQLQAFLSTADVAFRRSNALLTAPGIEQADLKNKLNGVFRELHAVKGEAAALTLTSFVQQIHAVEDTLTALRSRSTLSGNDFLPVVVKLDELMSHVGTVDSMQDRVAAFKPAGGTAPRPAPAHDLEHTDTIIIDEPVELDRPATPAVPRATAMNDMLQSLAQEVAASQAVSVRLVTRGLEDVPPRYASIVKDICIQMIRNSIVHGIEPAPQRMQHGKPGQSTVQISFAGDSADQYLLTVEDDGRGLDYEQIIDTALRQGLVRPQQAVSIDRASIYRLIFQPGFSTAGQISEHAGRGVGLDAVSTLVRSSGGKIGVSTVAGQYTRFKVLLPKAAAASATSAA